MDIDSMKSSIIKTLNNMANPANVTTELIQTIIRSNYTVETIRSLVLDPITSACIPKVELTNYTDMAWGFWVLFHMDPDTFVKKICEEQDMEHVMDILTRYFENNDVLKIYNYVQTTGKQGRIMLLRLHGKIMYLHYTLFETREEFCAEMTIHFIGIRSGKSALEFLEQIKTLRENAKRVNKEKHARRISLRMFDNGNPRGRYSFCTVPTTIILDHVQDKLDMIINMVKRSEGIQQDYEINSSIGVLLYGPHGTGKSTIARYLAMVMDRVLILTTADTLQDAVNYIKSCHEREKDRKHIMLIEDIDFMFADRRNVKKEDTNNSMMASTNYLFQVMDGVLSDSNLLVVATTNYIERLDPALIRDGRFDFKIEVTGLEYEQALKVCERFHVQPGEIQLQKWKVPISPASLQASILKYKVTDGKEIVIPKDVKEPKTKSEKVVDNEK